MEMKKIISLAVILSLLVSVMLVAVGAEAIDRRGVNERIESETDQKEIENSSNFEIMITAPQEGATFQKGETITFEYEVKNTGELKDTQVITQNVNEREVKTEELTIEAGEKIYRVEKFNAGYWAEQFEVTEVRLDSIDSPDIVELGNEFEATGEGHYAYLFPEVDQVSLLEKHLDDYRFTIREPSGNDILVKVPPDDIDLRPNHNYSTFEASVPTEGLEEGDYTLQLEALEENKQGYKSISKNLTLVDSSSDHENKIIRERGDLWRTEKNSFRNEFEIDLEDIEGEEEYELKVSSEDDEDSVMIIVSEESEAKEIHDWHDLDGIRDDLGGDYVLMNDLDENTEGYDELVDTEKGWRPIGEYDEENEEFVSFLGSFDGNGHEIRDLYINRPAEGHVGIFGTSEGKIENIGIVDAKVSGYWYVGSLVGSNSFGTVQNSYSIGEVSGDGAVGGLVGSNNYGRVIYSFTDGEVEGEESIGGLVGYQGGSPGPGWAFTENSYTLTDVSGEKEIGGLVGSNHHSKINSSYAAGEVEGEEDVGGLVGIIGLGGTADIEYSYWDVEITGQDESDGGTGLTTKQMIGAGAKENLDGFNFEEVWETVEQGEDDIEEDGYPILQELDRGDQLKAQNVFEEDEDDIIDRIREIPGFKPVILLLAGVIALALYQKKDKRS